MKKRHLHIGVIPGDLIRVRRATTRYGAKMYIDGDGWEAWGEAPGTDMNDGLTLHVVIEIRTEQSADLLLAILMHDGVSLVVSTSNQILPPYYAVLTDRHDWSLDQKTWDMVPA